MDPEEHADPTPPAGETTPATAPAPVASPETTDADAQTLTAAEARELRREAQSLRRRLREVEGQQTTSAQETATQVAALQAEFDALRATHSAAADALRAYRLRDAIAETARASDDLRGVDPDLAARLVEGIEWGEDGKPKGLAAALKSLVTRYPQIAAAPARIPSQPPAGGNGRVARQTLDDDILAQKRRQIGAL